jgi:beta-galactosidase
VVDGDFNLENRFAFTSADEFAGSWELVENGIVVKRCVFDVPSVAPLSKGRIELPKFETRPDCEYFVNVDFSLKSDTIWAKKGWKVARNQVALGIPPARRLQAADGGKVEFTRGDDSLMAVCGGTKAVFSLKTGTLSELVMNGKTILKDPFPGIVAGPRLTCMRALTDNDIWLRGRGLEDAGSIYLSGLTQLRYHARPVKIEKDRVSLDVSVFGAKSAGFRHKSVWTFAANGAISVKNTIEPFGTMPASLPRLGLSFKLDKDLEQIRYYGRGPRENYIDRKTASFFGVYESTVTEQFEAYVRPQDNGYRGDVRWVEFTGADGKGVKFTCSVPMFMQALHYEAEDMEFARQRRGQQRMYNPPDRRNEVCLNLDIRQLGLGGASCGPRPMDKYLVKAQKEEWTLKLEPCVR